MRRALLALALVVATTAVAREGTQPSWSSRFDERAGAGTLPLRLGGGEGTLPLRFDGQAIDLASSQTVNTSLLLTAATQAAMPPGQAGSLPCQLRAEHVSRHAASGSLTVSGNTYAVRGICYDADSQNMEIVAAAGGNRSFLVSRLPSPAPRALSGRLTIQAGSAASGRYSVSLRSNDPPVP